MEQLKMKIALAFGGILTGIALISTAAYAWFTISTTPEVTGITISIVPTGKEYPIEVSQNQTDWTTELHMDNIVEQYGPLRPISTFDGEHWYLPYYDIRGNVDEFHEVELSEVANRLKGKDGFEEPFNYLVYFDIWVRTRDTGTNYDMRLSNPAKNVGADEKYFGTFVLWDPQKSAKEDEVPGNDAMACTRIGIQMLGEDDENTSPFYIYEPNSVMRSSYFETVRDELLEDDNDLKPEEFNALKYIAASLENKTSTLPDGSTKTELKIGQALSISDYITSYLSNVGNSTYVNTVVPRFVSDKTADADAVYELQTLAAGSNEVGNKTVHLITQGNSSWSEDYLNSWEAGAATAQSVNSRNVGTIGTLNSTPTIQTLTYGQEYKMRIYVWLEGQDIDCWNQITEGNIYVNLEFLGEEAAGE